jgi:1,4-alpha-glucan branching enzyme
MGDEGNLTSGFPFFVDLPDEAAAAKRADRYEQMNEMFNETVAEGELPEPNDPGTFDRAKIQWSEYEVMAERRDALRRFRELGTWRQQMVWPLAATPCVDARSFRIGNCLIINWVFERGTITMAMNPTDHPYDIPCEITSHPVSTGEFSQHGNVLRLGAWSAVVW